MPQNATELSMKFSLSRKQERAAELLLSGETRTATAKAVNVDRSTLYRWLEQPGFVAEINCRRAEFRESSWERLRRIQIAALATIEAAVDAGDVRTSLYVLRGTGLLSGQPLVVGPTHESDVAREQLARKNHDALDDLILELGG